MPFFCIPLFACQRRVESLDFCASKLEDVPEGIERHAAHLRELVLDTNDIRDLPKNLFQCKKLERLSLQGNLITEIPDEIGDLQNLIELNLEANDVMHLPESLKQCSKLSVLALSRNVKITTLPSSITELAYLTELSLNDTNLTELPKDIGKLTNLEFLELRENELRDHSVPSSIRNLKSLRHLDLGENKLTFLPNEIGQLSKLRVLIVDENELDSLPEAITNCENLEELNVSKNQIARLPDGIGDLSALCELLVGNNRLEALPNSIGRLKNLTILNVEENRITELTPAIGGCVQLNDLYANNNLITTIPSTVGHLAHLKNLHLAKNRISEIPPAIGNCKAVSVLSLRSNKLTELPMEIGKMESLTVLDVCGNRLIYLPFTITVLQKLRALWLSHSQTQPKMALTETRDPVSNIRAYTCVLLPQTDSTGDAISRCSAAANQKVKFEEAESDSDGEPSGRLVRRGTPLRKGKKDAEKVREAVAATIEFKEPSKSILKTRRVASEASDEIEVEMESIHGDEAVCEVVQPEEVQKEEEIVVEENVDLGITPPERKNPPMRVNVAVERGNDGELGWTIAGGVESVPVRSNDNGIYVTKVVSEGPAFRAGIRVGDRLITVNGNSLEGITHSDAVDLFQVPEDVMLFEVVRDFEAEVLDDEEVESAAGIDLSKEEIEIPTNEAVQAEKAPSVSKFGNLAVCLEEIPPLAVSSPIPSTSNGPAKRPPPPVAPKPPKSVIDQITNEKLNFSMKINKFEAEIVAQTAPSASSSLPPPSRRPLLTAEEVEKLKQEERKKLATANDFCSDIDESITSFENALSEYASPSRTLPAVVRTKKAENRLLAALSPTPSAVSELSTATTLEEQLAEAKKRSEWRASRLKSIDGQCATADELIRRVNDIHSRMENIGEELSYCASPTPSSVAAAAKPNNESFLSP